MQNVRDNAEPLEQVIDYFAVYYLLGKTMDAIIGIKYVENLGSPYEKIRGPASDSKRARLKKFVERERAAPICDRWLASVTKNSQTRARWRGAESYAPDTRADTSRRRALQDERDLREIRVPQNRSGSREAEQE